MASKNRERKAIDAVACPACGSRKGELCRRPDGKGGYAPLVQYGRPMICAERRTVWQMVRDKEIS